LSIVCDGNLLFDTAINEWDENNQPGTFITDMPTETIDGQAFTLSNNANTDRKEDNCDESRCCKCTYQRKESGFHSLLLDPKMFHGLRVKLRIQEGHYLRK